MKNYKANPETRQSPLVQKVREGRDSRNTDDGRTEAKRIQADHASDQGTPEGEHQESVEELLQRYEVDGHVEPATIEEVLDGK